MELDEEVLKSFAMAAQESYALAGLGLDETVSLTALQREIADDFGELSEQEVMERRFRNCGIGGTRAEDFSEWLLKLGCGRSVICGIRHLGMNLEKPFVQLVPNFQFESAGEIREFYRKHLAERFACFSPRWVQVYSSTGAGSEAGGSLYLVARADEMQSKVLKGESLDLSLVDVADDRYFDWYQETYDAFHQDCPELKDWVLHNDLSLMQSCRAEGLVRLVMIEGERAGLVAADRQPFLGHEGVYFVELLLTRKWRGRSLGKFVQKAFVSECCQSHEMVWGQIDRRNHASLHTARANGRRVVRGECFLEI